MFGNNDDASTDATINPTADTTAPTTDQPPVAVADDTAPAVVDAPSTEVSPTEPVADAGTGPTDAPDADEKLLSTTGTPDGAADDTAATPDDASSTAQPDDSQPGEEITATPSSDDSKTANGSDDDLLELKKTAVEELAPLLDQLDQTPEEKFKTIMMLIQATDNKSLVPQAHDVAKNISDDKERAQALLDVINEINYFTHKDD